MSLFERIFRVILAYWAKQPQEMEYIPLTPPVSPKTAPSEPLPVTPKPKPSMNMLDILSTAIRDFEGAPGDLNYRNNNPGNFRYSPVGYLAKYGNVVRNGGFAKFPTYEQGWMYLQESLKHWARIYPQWTIQDLFNHYAPPSDNNPTVAYANNVAGKCGVPVTTKLSVLLKDYI